MMGPPQACFLRSLPAALACDEDKCPIGLGGDQRLDDPTPRMDAANSTKSSSLK
jgi:hypothetical protein